MENVIKKDNGLRIIVNKEGYGPIPKEGQTVVTHYKGYLEDGTVFDSSYNLNQPFEFPLGQGRVIKGWDESFAEMKGGTEATLVIPSDLAYGQRAMGAIPANSNLIFDVHLVSIKP